MQELVRSVWRDDTGQDLVEYALIAGLISVICYSAIRTAGQSISTVWDTISTAMASAA